MTKEMVARVKKKLKEMGSIQDCSQKMCKFPNTCNWNHKCMQKELLLSISSKKTLLRPDTVENAKKTGIKKT